MKDKTWAARNTPDMFPDAGERVFVGGRWRSPERGCHLPATPADLGQACEYFVAADLLARGIPVTKPLNTNGAHDLHARFASGGWYTIQVKAARRNEATGKLVSRARRDISSDVLALVFMPTKQIRYVGHGRSLPVELTE